MIEDIDSTELDDPAGGVQLPRVGRDVARAYALAGAAVGVSAMFGAGTWTPMTTFITA